MSRSRCLPRQSRRYSGSGDVQILLATAEHDVFIGLEFAFSLATELRCGGEASRELLVLADEDRRVTAILCDPDPLLGLMPALLAEQLGVVAMTALVVTRSDRPIEFAEPPADELASYLSLCTIFADQGIDLLDLVLTDTINSRSMEIAAGAGRWLSEADIP